MWKKPANIVLAALAATVLLDMLIAKPTDEGDFLISVGAFGALLSRAGLADPQSLMISILGLGLAAQAILRNHGVIDRNSSISYVALLLTAFVYALWEKILRLLRS
ncbi:MAG TPA: hypothetical protein VJN93_16705 [Candidatus Acidoferrum sp.]|nr:hypothetical protein [Candidatus Acidoferrum sp.]